MAFMNNIPSPKMLTQKMEAVIQFFSRLYTLLMIISSILIPQTFLIIRFAISRFWKSHKRSTSKRRYIKLIEEKSSKFIFGKVERPRLVDCIICLSKFTEGEEIRELQCEHCFHRDCLDSWLHHDRATCPLCRRVVLPEEIVAEHRRIRIEEEDSSGAEEFVLLLTGRHGSSLRGAH